MPTTRVRAGVVSEFLVPARLASMGPELRDEVQVPDGWRGHLIPNFGNWAVGDVVLVAGDGSKPAAAIAGLQATKGGPGARPYARFTHAALYVGRGMLVDATLEDGVACRSVWSYAYSRELTLRRLPALSLTVAEVASIATIAQDHVGTPYSLSEAVRSALMPETVPNVRRLYCSTFVGHVIARATGVLLWERREHRPLHPAVLAGHPDLQVVHVEWRRPVSPRDGRA